MAENLIYVTQEWLIKLQEELNFLKTIKRVEIAEKLKNQATADKLKINTHC